jgi:hypothetical protein
MKFAHKIGGAGFHKGSSTIQQAENNYIISQSDPCLPASHLGRLTLAHLNLNLPQQRHNLLRAKPLPRHDKTSFHDNCSQIAWCKKSQSGHSCRVAFLSRFCDGSADWNSLRKIAQFIWD